MLTERSRIVSSAGFSLETLVTLRLDRPRGQSAGLVGGADKMMDVHQEGGAPYRSVTLTPQEVDQAAHLLLRLVPSKSDVPHLAPQARASLLSIAKFCKLVREERNSFFAPCMFGEPGWDLLLGLYVGEESGSTQTVSSLAKVSRTAISTADRWIDYLAEKELLDRRPSCDDRRTIVVSLTRGGRDALDRYFAQILDGVAALRFD